MWIFAGRCTSLKSGFQSLQSHPTSSLLSLFYGIDVISKPPAFGSLLSYPLRFVTPLIPGSTSCDFSSTEQALSPNQAVIDCHQDVNATITPEKYLHCYGPWASQLGGTIDFFHPFAAYKSPTMKGSLREAFQSNPAWILQVLCLK